MAQWGHASHASIARPRRASVLMLQGSASPGSVPRGEEVRVRAKSASPGSVTRGDGASQPAKEGMEYAHTGGWDATATWELFDMPYCDMGTV